jgi:molybdate transport system substrate-binding protein
MRRLALAALLLAVGCGEAEPSDRPPRLVVSAAASLSEALTACSEQFEGADVRLSFAGSDELAAQIRQGVTPDVYAAANTRLPEQLADEGLLGTPVEFATNELVIAVGGDGTAVERVEDLAKPGIDLAIGAESVPVGAYTREVLGRLPDGLERRILANVRSEEPDVRGVVGKLTQGAADAGFVYLTDVTEGITGVELPPELRPTVAYGAGVVEGSRRPELAQRYLDGLMEGPCADALREEGFGPPPAG